MWNFRLRVLVYLQARFFFQQLISGVSYCHAMVSNFGSVCALSEGEFELWLNWPPFLLIFYLKQVCHRDLKLENTLLDGSPSPRLKICDFGYSKVQDMSITICLYHYWLVHQRVFAKHANFIILIFCIHLCWHRIVLFPVLSAAFSTKIDGRNSCLYSSGSVTQERIWWEGNISFYFPDLNFCIPVVVQLTSNYECYVLN